MADKEIEQQNRTLKELVDNQKETNKTLTTGFAALQKSGAEDSTFMSKNLGSLMEVAATMKAQKKSEQFDKKEEVTEVDEKIEKLTEKNVEEGKKSRNLLRTIADFSSKGYDKGVIAASKTREMAREGSQKLRKLGDTIVKGVTKGFRETWGSMTKVAKKLTFAGVIFAAFMIAFMNFLGSDLFEKGFDILRNKIIPGIGKVWEILKSIGGHLATFFGPLYKDIMNYLVGPDGGGPGGKKSIGQIFSDNLFASLVAIGGLALLLSPKMLLAGFLIGTTWKIIGVLGGALATIFHPKTGVLSLLGQQILNMGRAAMGRAPIGSAAALAASRAPGPKVDKLYKLKGPGGQMQTYKWAGQQWVTPTGGTLSNQAGIQKAFTEKMTNRMFGPGGKFGARGAAFWRAAKGLGPLGTAVIAGLSGYNAWNIMQNMPPGPARSKALGEILYGTLGTLGMISIGAGIGTMIGGPLGGIIGGMAGGWFGEDIGIYLANWLMGGDDVKPPKGQGSETGGGWPGPGAGSSLGQQPGIGPTPDMKTIVSASAGRPMNIAGKAAGLKAGGWDMSTLLGTGGDKPVTGMAARQKLLLIDQALAKENYETGRLKQIENLALDYDYDWSRMSGPSEAVKELREMNRLMKQRWFADPALAKRTHGPNNFIDMSKKESNVAINGRGTVPTGVLARVLGWISLPAAPLNTSSDIRLKEDIELLGKSPSGINIYSFKYIGEEEKYQGVMAQEVLWASTPDEKGYYSVDYSKLDVDFIKLN